MDAGAGNAEHEIHELIDATLDLVLASFKPLAESPIRSQLVIGGLRVPEHPWEVKL
jgi:hypothetical protein